VYLLERGGLAADDAAARVRARHEARAATFAELFALGRFETRRGQLTDALAHYKAASTLRSGDTRLLTNWGNALLASGNPDGAAELYTAASKGATLAAPSYNLAMVLRRKAKTVPDEAVSGVLNQAREAINVANDLDPSLLQREPPPEERLLVGRLVLSLPLPDAELAGLASAPAGGERVEAQLSRMLMAGMTGPVAWGLPLLAGGLLFAWGFLRGGLKASKVCDKCGRAVCRRCDPELGIGSVLCTQCVNVFSRKGQVPPQMRARKEAQVFSYQAWMERLALALSAVVSGAGHVFSGLPVRGALYAFLFLFGVGAVVFHGGVLRAPYGEVPTWLKLTFAGLLLLPVYTLTLRGLYKRQNG
jgi:tetratricopeptide (TPR) repeat protein